MASNTLATPRTAIDTGKKVVDTIPYKGGWIAVTPYKDGQLDYSKKVKTNIEHYIQTAFSNERTTEELNNGNGPAKEMPQSEKFSIAATNNVMHHAFHAIVAGRIAEVKEDVMPETKTIKMGVVDTSKTGFKFEATGKQPAPIEGTEYGFILEDSVGEALTLVTTEPTAGQYKYDSDTKTITVDESYKGTEMTLLYYYTVTLNSYRDNPIIVTNEFMVEAYGVAQTTDGKKVARHTILKKAVVTGSLPEENNQQGVNNELVYNFATTPMPEGVSAYYDKYAVIA